MRLPYSIGIELTGVPRIPFDDERSDSTCWTLLGTIKKKLPKRYKRAAHIDWHCLEIPSPILKTKEGTRLFFNTVRRVMKLHKITPHHPDVVCGGGHIHLGIKKAGIRQHIFDVASHYPWLPWIFSQPDEEGACDNIRKYITCQGEPMEYIPYHNKEFLMSCSSFNTLEFRFFEAARNWSEQWDHIEFALKFAKWAAKQPKCKMKQWPRDKKQLQKIKKQDCIVEFRKMLGALGLSYPRYEKYVKRNLLPRWQLGRSRR